MGVFYVVRPEWCASEGAAVVGSEAFVVSAVIYHGVRYNKLAEQGEYGKVGVYAIEILQGHVHACRGGGGRLWARGENE